MRTLEEYMELLKNSDPMYHWPIERFEKKKPEREKIHKEFPHVVTYSGIYEFHDDLEDWCREKFGDRNGQCHWENCEMGFHVWYKKSGLEEELETLLHREISKPSKKSSLKYKIWEEYNDLVMDAHFDMIKNDLIDKPGEHSHKGTWQSLFIVKTGYDYGYEDYCFKNSEDAVYFKLMWDEWANKQ